MNDEVHTLSSPDDFAKLWTEAELKDALQGIGPDWENLQQPMGRVVVEMSSQTDPVVSHFISVIIYFLIRLPFFLIES